MTDEKGSKFSGRLPPAQFAHSVTFGLDGPTLQFANKLLTGLNQSETLKRIEQKLEKIIMDLQRLESGLTAATEGQEAISAGIEEVRQEVADLKNVIGNNAAAQERINAIGDSLAELGTKSAAQGQALRDINPDTPVAGDVSKRGGR